MKNLKGKLLLSVFAFASTVGLSNLAHADCSSGNCADTGHTVVGDGSSVNDNDNNNNNTNLNNNENNNNNNNENTNVNQNTGVNGNVTTGNVNTRVDVEAGASSAFATHGSVNECVVIKPGFGVSIVEASLNIPGSVEYVQACEDGKINIANNTFENSIIGDFLNSADPQEKITAYVALATKFPLFNDVMLSVDSMWSRFQVQADATGKPVCVDENGFPLSTFSIAMMIVKAENALNAIAAEATVGENADSTPTRVRHFGPRR